MLCTQQYVQTRVNEFECCKRIVICETLVMDVIGHFVLRAANILFQTLSY